MSNQNYIVIIIYLFKKRFNNKLLSYLITNDHQGRY